jgi:hypothetical protein
MHACESNRNFLESKESMELLLLLEGGESPMFTLSFGERRS